MYVNRWHENISKQVLVLLLSHCPHYGHIHACGSFRCSLVLYVMYVSFIFSNDPQAQRYPCCSSHGFAQQFCSWVWYCQGSILLLLETIKAMTYEPVTHCILNVVQKVWKYLFVQHICNLKLTCLLNVQFCGRNL